MMLAMNNVMMGDSRNHPPPPQKPMRRKLHLRPIRKQYKAHQCEEPPQQQQLQKPTSTAFRVGRHALHTFEQIERTGPAVEPLRFDPPYIERAVVQQDSPLAAWDPISGTLQYCRNVILQQSPLNDHENDKNQKGAVVAYWPRRDLQKAIYGSVCLSLVLRKIQPRKCAETNNNNGNKIHTDASGQPVEWEITSEQVAIKKLNRAKIDRLKGRHAEDPLQEIAAMQFLEQRRQEDGILHMETHVMTTTAVWQDETHLYSIMPYCAYGDLYGVVCNYVAENSLSHHGHGDSSTVATPEPVARYFFRQILRGLHTLQANGICHRDLSLENIMVDSNRNVKIIDFGMCLRIPYNDPTKKNGDITTVVQGSMRRLIAPQVTCGKAKYMSPEIKANRDPMDGFAVDLWSTGVILYTLLTGFHPYDHPDLTDPRYQAIVDGLLVELLHSWGVFLSPTAEDLLHNMLQPNPRRRLTLAQVMEHPWVTEGPVHMPELLSSRNSSLMLGFGADDNKVVDKQ